jgi:iron complex outermembrane recepter protein
LPVSDSVALRVAGYYNSLPGWISAFGPNGSVKRDANSGEKGGGRLALLWKPREAVSITPRVVDQKFTTDGYLRADVHNILANPYMTTSVSLGQYGQHRKCTEGLDDDFKLCDLKLEWNFGATTLTSVSSYTDRRVTVLRAASQLTGSVTAQLGGTPADVNLNSPLYDRSKTQSFLQELCLASNQRGNFDREAGAFFEHAKRRYGQDLPTPGWDAVYAHLGSLLGPSPVGVVDTPFFSDLNYDFKQYALFGDGALHIDPQWSATVGVRWFKFTEDKSVLFRCLFSNQ